MTTNTAEAETTETTHDGPLLDLTDAGVKKFIKQAKARGYVTMDELNKVLPSEEVTSEAIEDTLAMLSEMGVNVIEAEEAEAEGPTEVVVRLLRGFAVFAGFLILDDVDAHLVERGHHVLDLLGGHLVLRQRFVQFVIGYVAALLGAREDLLDRRIVEVDQGRIAIAAFTATAVRRCHCRLRHAIS